MVFTFVFCNISRELIKGIKVGLKEVEVSHLHFTDDSSFSWRSNNEAFENVLLLGILS